MLKTANDNLNQNAHLSAACPAHQITAHFNVSKKSPGMEVTSCLEMDLDHVQQFAAETTHQVIVQVDVLDHQLLVGHHLVFKIKTQDHLKLIMHKQLKQNKIKLMLL